MTEENKKETKDFRSNPFKELEGDRLKQHLENEKMLTIKQCKMAITSFKLKKGLTRKKEERQKLEGQIIRIKLIMEEKKKQMEDTKWTRTIKKIKRKK